MLYVVAKIGADTAENERNIADILTKIRDVTDSRDGRGGDDDGRADPRRGPAPRARGHPLGPGSIGTLGFFLRRLETRWDVSAISRI